MDSFLHQLTAGLATGAIYASLSLALVMIFQSTRHMNFAQGQLAMFATYLAWAMIQAGLPYWAAFLCTVLAAFVLGVLLERLVVRRMQHAPVLSAVAVLVGLMIIFNSLAGWIFTYSIQTFPSPFPEKTIFANNLLSAHDLGSVAVTLVLLGLLYVFFQFTPLGLALRAVALNPTSSRLVGIRVDWILALGWGVASAVGAVAGMMVAPVVYLEPDMMSGVLLYAFAGALIGGIDSPIGAVLGGLLVGVLENLLGAYVIGNELKLSVALALIVGVLLVRPAGFFGSKHVTRV
jgi:branched-chain amino acid transport system permease protein